MKKKLSRATTVNTMGLEVQNLYKNLTILHSGLDKAFERELNRSLPLPELLLDRWERALRLGFGEDSSIYDSAVVLGNVKVGRSTWIGPNVLLDGSGGLEIGHFCSISAGVHIYSHNTVKWALSGGKAGYEYAPTSIGNGCFIGAQSIIQNGVRVGDHCLIGANSFVSGNVDSFAIAAGSPAKVIGKVIVGENGEINLEYFK